MSKFRFTIKVMAIAIFMFATVSIAQAQASRTWVSGVGDDANPCSRTAPCKTWAGAISKTAACGEIDALDPTHQPQADESQEPALTFARQEGAPRGAVMCGEQLPFRRRGGRRDRPGSRSGNRHGGLGRSEPEA